MTSIGVISDVHANITALEAVLADLHAEGVECIVCCGDVVGYGPWPREVIARLRDVDALCVQGNHDAASIGAFPSDHFNADARAAIDWTRAALDQEDLQFLADLEQMYIGDDFVLVHGSLRGPLWEYMRDAFVARESFPLLARSIGLFGHSHIQGGFVRFGEHVDAITPGRPIAIVPGRQYLINPGSVGQPRDGDPRAAYAIVDLDCDSVLFKRVAYDIKPVMQRIELVGLPRRFGERLEAGR